MLLYFYHIVTLGAQNNKLSVAFNAELAGDAGHEVMLNPTVV